MMVTQQAYGVLFICKSSAHLPGKKRLVVFSEPGYAWSLTDHPTVVMQDRSESSSSLPHLPEVMSVASLASMVTSDRSLQTTESLASRGSTLTQVHHRRASRTELKICIVIAPLAP
jgi:hypothetical protein